VICRALGRSDPGAETWGLGSNGIQGAGLEANVKTFLFLGLFLGGGSLVYAQEKQPKMPGPAVMQGEMALQKGLPKQAIDIYEKGLKKQPRSKRLLTGLIRAKLMLNRCDEGLERMLPMRHTRVASPQVLELLSACFARYGNYAEAVYWAEERLALGPPKVEAIAAFAAYRLGAGERFGAIEAIELAELVDPHAGALKVVQLQVAIGKGQVSEADLLLEELERAAGRRSQTNWLLRTRLALDLGDLNAALEASDSCVKMGFQFSPIRGLRGEIFRRLGELDSAEEALTTVYADAVGVVGLKAIEIRLRVDQGLLEQAESILSEALRISPLRPDVVASAWYLARAKGDLEEMSVLKELYELVQSNPYRRLERLVPVGESRGL